MSFSSILKYFSCFLFCFLINSCFLQQKTAYLNTDLPQVLSAVELFNASSKSYKIVVNYSKDPIAALRSEEKAPALIISRELNIKNKQDYFYDLAGLLRKEIEDEVFIPSLLNKCIENKKLYILPISFSFSALFYVKSVYNKLQIKNKDTLPEELPFFMEFNDFQKIHQPYNYESWGTLYLMGFSPFWTEDYLISLGRLLGLNWKFSGTSLSWDNPSLNKGIKILEEWINNYCGGSEKEGRFSEKFIYQPYDKLLENGRVAFFPFNQSAVNVFEQKDWEYGMLVLTNQGKFYCNDNLTYLALCRQAPGKAAAESFVRWLCDPTKQKQIIEINSRQKVSKTAFFDGFSSLRGINQDLFKQYFPQLEEIKDFEKRLLFPSPLQESWSSIKKQVLFPWIKGRVHKNIKEGLPEYLGRWHENISSGKDGP